jgi:glycosyltransferase involved in cell wall biosynthesis
MQALIRHLSPDIVHTHTHVGAVWGRAAALLAGVRRVVHTEHSSDTALSRVERIAAAILNRFTATTITFSQRTAKLVQARETIRNLQIIPNGIQVRALPSPPEKIRAKQKLGVTPDTLVIGSVANLHPHKDPALAIEAVSLLPETLRRNIMLAYFGRGPLEEELNELARRLDVMNLVQFFGFRDDVRDLLAGLDLFLATSPRESMPMSLLEAMNAALPIIGIANTGVLDLVVDRETGFIVNKRQPRVLAEVIRWTLENPEWRTRAGIAAYGRLVANFDIETVADRHVELYTRLVARAPVH